MKAKFELADIIRRFGNDLVAKGDLTPVQINALHKIVQCRTAAMGGHEEQCDSCAETRYSYNSCLDRHCPKCQAAKQAVWIERLLESTLPVKHYHIVFTVPHCLNKICLYNESDYHRILFSAVWRTLHSFGYTHFGVETGAVCVLHTWGQNLSLHPCLRQAGPCPLHCACCRVFALWRMETYRHIRKLPLSGTSAQWHF